jgi:hypothetical protein
MWTRITELEISLNAKEFRFRNLHCIRTKIFVHDIISICRKDIRYFRLKSGHQTETDVSDWVQKLQDMHHTPVCLIYTLWRRVLSSAIKLSVVRWKSVDVFWRKYRQSLQDWRITQARNQHEAGSKQNWRLTNTRTWCYIPEDVILHNNSSENIRSLCHVCECDYIRGMNCWMDLLTTYKS